MGNNLAKLTVPEKILIAATEINGAEKSFTAEDLVLAAWRRFPDTFGLQGYAEKYPDSNRVLTNIMGNKGLRGKGWIRKVGEKRYKITEAGREAARLLSSEKRQVSRSSSLSRESRDLLVRLINAKALDKCRSCQKDTLTFSDACSFWNISVRSTASLLKIRLADIETILSAAENIIQKNEIEALSFTHGESDLTLKDINDLRVLHLFMIDKFKNELDVIRKRYDERKF